MLLGEFLGVRESDSQFVLDIMGVLWLAATRSMADVFRLGPRDIYFKLHRRPTQNAFPKKCTAAISCSCIVSEILLRLCSRGIKKPSLECIRICFPFCKDLWMVAVGDHATEFCHNSEWFFLFYWLRCHMFSYKCIVVAQFNSACAIVFVVLLLL